MMEKEVIRVACPSQYLASTCLDNKKKRVAAYARVSTDSEDQIHSFKAQIDEYTKKITSNPDWEFVGMYSDEGISGTSLKKRDGLNALLKEAKKGNVDLILVKSISRLGRNTLDVLTIIKDLRAINVEIKFEKENLSSLDTKTDMILTFHSSIAQEESKNISDNVKWGIRKRMKEGDWKVPTEKFLGYTKDENGNMIIDEEQAEIVRAIFNLYLANKSIKEIIAFLEACNYLTGCGKSTWSRQNIMQILKNEKYCGDLLLQKTVVTDYLSHQSKNNKDGKYADLWLVKNHHPAIISREVFDLVQTIIKYRKGERYLRPDFDNPLSTKLYCALCGRPLIFQTRSDNKRVFSCNVSRRGVERNKCSLSPVAYDEIAAISIKAMKEYCQSNVSSANLINTISEIGESSKKQDEINNIKEEISLAEMELKRIIEEKMESDNDTDDERLSFLYKETKKRLNELKIKLDELGEETYRSFISENRCKEIATLIQDESNDEAYLKLIDVIIVNEDGSITIIDNNGLSLYKEEVSSHIKQLNNLTEVIHGYYSSPLSGRVYKYKVVRLEEKPWKK